MFLFILLLVGIALASLYLSWRLHRGLAVFFPRLPYWPICALTFMIAILLALGFVQALLPISSGTKHILSLVSGYSMSICVYWALFTILSEIILLIARFFPVHRHFRGFVTLGVITLTAITCIGGFIHAREISHVTYHIQLEGKKDISDIHMVMISDLHLGAIGSESRLPDIVEEINGLNPDIICIAGDFFDTDFNTIQDPDAAIKTLQGLRATYGTYACLGNHDGGKTYQKMIDFLNQANIHLLNDDYAIIDERFVIVGRLDGFPIGGYGDEARKDLDDIFAREDATLPVIVMEHNPANIHEYTVEADLILSGHTHKGQIFPANLVTDRLFAVDYGYFREGPNRPHVIVSSGIGTWFMPMRVGSDCEIVSIRFSH